MDSGQGERLIKVLTQIKDRLPAATTPPAAPDDFRPWEIFGPREQAVLVAWLTPENQVTWIKKGTVPGNGMRPLYVRNSL